MDRSSGQGESTARTLRDALRALSKARAELERGCTWCGVELAEPRAHALLALMGLDGEGGAPALTIQQLSAHTDIDRSNVSRLCQRMERDGELERARCPQDARAKLVRLTEEGVARAERVDAMSLARFEHVVGHLGEGEREEVLRALTILTDALRHAHDELSAHESAEDVQHVEPT